MCQDRDSNPQDQDQDLKKVPRGLTSLAYTNIKHKTLKINETQIQIGLHKTDMHSGNIKNQAIRN